MTLVIKKKAIIDWVSSIEDKDVIDQLLEYQKVKSMNFKAAIENAITINEVKEQTDTYIKSLDWQK